MDNGQDITVSCPWTEIAQGQQMAVMSLICTLFMNLQFSAIGSFFRVFSGISQLWFTHSKLYVNSFSFNERSRYEEGGILSNFGNMQSLRPFNIVC